MDPFKRRREAFLSRRATEIRLRGSTLKFKKGKIKPTPVRKSKIKNARFPKYKRRRPSGILRSGDVLADPTTIQAPSYSSDAQIASYSSDIPQKGHKRYKTLTNRVMKKTRRGSGKWLGPYPAPLGDDLILSLELIMTPLQETQRDKAGLIAVMTTIYDRLYEVILKMIDRYTPEDTGYLKRSLKFSISRGYADLPNINDIKPTLKLWLHATPDYAGIVNKMNTISPPPHVRHPPHLKNYKIGKSGIELNDPKAIGHFYDFILLNGRKKAKEIVTEELRNLAGNIGMRYVDLKRWFKMRYK